ncbi:MAG: adenosylcobinamide-phosphate synthase CbiB [Alphaproteobacteria bacterium]
MLADGLRGVAASGIDWVVGPGAALLLLMGLALDWLLGDPRRLPHPVRLIGAATNWLDRKLNRPERGEPALLARGVVVALALSLAAAGVGVAVSVIAGAIPYGWAIELLLVAVMLAQRDLFDHVRRVSAALRRDGLAGGRKAVSHIVGRDVEVLDEHGVARAAVETCVESYGDGVVAPAFWYLVLGLPGLFAYKAINTMDSMIGHETPRYQAFGMAAARLDDAANFLPARLAGTLLSLAALFVPRASVRQGFRIMLRDHGKHRSPNAGWPEAAAAGALGLALLGPRRYDGEVAAAPWLGDGTARATEADIRRVLMLYVAACLLLAASVAVIAVFAY